MNQVRLQGWKAIGNFLGRDRTTAIRWAKERGLPVHRVPGGRTGTVYALQSELEEWLANGVDRTRSAADEAEKPAPLAERKRWLTGGLILTAAAATAFVALIKWQTVKTGDAPVSIATIESGSDDVATRRFARSLSADLARFANASTDIAVYDQIGTDRKRAQFGVGTSIEGVPTDLIVRVWLVSQDDGSILWSRTIKQEGAGPALFRERVAANVVGLLRCSFGISGDERRQMRMSDLSLLLSICQANIEYDFALGLARAEKLVLARPDLAISWAALALSQSGASEKGDNGLLAKAREHARRAAAIKPKSLAAQLANLAVIGETDPATLNRMQRALHAYPNEPKLLQGLSVSMFNAGYVRASVAPSLLAVRSDPTSVFGRDVAVRRLAAAGRKAAARQLQYENEGLWPGHPLVQTQGARLAAETGSRSDMERLLFDAATLDDADAPEPGGQNNTSEPALYRLKRYADVHSEEGYMIARMYESFGDRRAALYWLARAPTRAAAANQWSLLFWPNAAGLRTEPAFFHKMVENGLLDIWRAQKKWPDFCADPGLKYDCTTEAAKYLQSNGFKRNDKK